MGRLLGIEVFQYRGTSLIRKRFAIVPYSRAAIRRVLGTPCTQHETHFRNNCLIGRGGQKQLFISRKTLPAPWQFITETMPRTLHPTLKAVQPSLGSKKTRRPVHRLARHVRRGPVTPQHDPPHTKLLRGNAASRINAQHPTRRCLYNLSQKQQTRHTPVKTCRVASRLPRS